MLNIVRASPLFNRVHMAKMLVKGGNVLLLDEPTNDLEVETLRALEEALESFAGCAVVISHDRFFLDRLATHLLALEGDSHVEWFEGNLEAHEEDKRRRLGDDADRPHALTYKKLTRWRPFKGSRRAGGSAPCTPARGCFAPSTLVVRHAHSRAPKRTVEAYRCARLQSRLPYW